MAVVSDARWLAPALKVFSALIPGQARAFPLADLEAAKTWAAEDASLLTDPDSVSAPPTVPGRAQR